MYIASYKKSTTVNYSTLTCRYTESSLMAGVFLAAKLAFLFLQFAVSQDIDAACTEALNTLTANNASCTATAQNPRVMCSGQCGTYFENIFDSCSPEVILFG